MGNEDGTLMMILKMTGAMLLSILATALVYRFWQKREKTLWLKIGIGVFFGLCCIVSNHLGIDYGAMLLNVRDVAPLAAGLFFSPLSGIIAGLIGGIERFLIGEFWGIGPFTQVSCSLSTCLAGFLAAAMFRWIFRGKRPPIVPSFMVGAVTEVFHMYVLLLTNQDQISFAYDVVSECAIPMIVFTALGMAGCSLAAQRMSHDYQWPRFFRPKEQIPVFVHFHRGLLIVTVILFFVSIFPERAIQTQISEQNITYRLNSLVDENQYIFKELNGDIAAFKDRVRLRHTSADTDTSFVVDTESMEVLWPYTGSAENEPEFTEQLSQADVDTIRNKANQPLFSGGLEFLSYFDTYALSVPLTDRYYLLEVCFVSFADSHANYLVYETLFSNILIFSTFYVLISLTVENLVVRNLKEVNRSLGRIADGQLTETVSVRTSLEFSELSDDINKTVSVLRGYIDEAEHRMEKDLKLAADIQDAALPKNFTFRRNDFRIYALMDPAKEVGGDFYDFFFIDNNTLALVIADVSGKSIPAAMFMMRSKTAIKNFARSGNDAAEVLFNVNNTLCEGNDANMFVTVWLGIIDLRTGLMQCANAGHEYPVLRRAGGEYELLKDKHGLVLAVMKDIPMVGYELRLNPGDRLFVYTDGVPEAINENNEAYGSERLLHRLNETPDASEREILHGVRRDVQTFAGSAEQFDDITMLGFTYLGQDTQDESGA